MIIIPNIDLKIWNPERYTIEIIRELQKTGHADIDVNGEGPDCTDLGLYSILDSICITFGYPKSAFTIHTKNQLERHNEYNIVITAPLYIPSGQEFARKNTLPPKNWDNIKHFGIFISRSSWQRLWMASHVWQNYKDKSLLTYHYDYASDYHKSHLGFNELTHHIGVVRAVDTAAEFIKTLPQKNETIDSYPILTPAHFSVAKLYDQIFLEIVCETFLSGTSFYPTEKTWRPFIGKTPFLTIGPRYFLSNLKRLGFRTFSPWFGESYDEDGGIIAIENIQSTLKRLSTMTVDELHSMYIDMKPTLDHNYDTFMNLKESDFAKVFQ